MVRNVFEQVSDLCPDSNSIAALFVHGVFWGALTFWLSLGKRVCLLCFCTTCKTISCIAEQM